MSITNDYRIASISFWLSGPGKELNYDSRYDLSTCVEMNKINNEYRVMWGVNHYLQTRPDEFIHRIEKHVRRMIYEYKSIILVMVDCDGLLILNYSFDFKQGLPLAYRLDRVAYHLEDAINVEIERFFIKRSCR